MRSSRGGFTYMGKRTATNLFVEGGAKVSTAQAKFGASSLLLTTNSADWVNHPLDTKFSFGTGDFCVEGWFYATNWSSYRTLWTSGNGSNTGNIAIYMNGGNTMEIYNNGVGPSLFTKTGFSLATNTWYHIAVTRSGTTMRCFKNGTQVSTNATQAYNWTSTGTRAYIGNDGISGGFSFVGHIDSFRVTKGAARYTANFTEPTAPLPNDANTSLLCQFEQPNNSTYINDDNL